MYVINIHNAFLRRSVLVLMLVPWTIIVCCAVCAGAIADEMSGACEVIAKTWKGKQP